MKPEAGTYPGIYFYKRVVQAKLFIDKHYGEAVDLEDISGAACFSKFHFTRLFKLAYGKTPHQYLTQVRMEKAKELLQEDIPVADACLMTGFNSIGSFSALFKKYTGTAPAAFRMQSMQRREHIRKAPLSFIPACYADKNGWSRQKSNFEEVQ